MKENTVNDQEKPENKGWDRCNFVNYNPLSRLSARRHQFTPNRTDLANTKVGAECVPVPHFMWFESCICVQFLRSLLAIWVCVWFYWRVLHWRVWFLYSPSAIYNLRLWWPALMFVLECACLCEWWMISVRISWLPVWRLACNALCWRNAREHLFTGVNWWFFFLWRKTFYFYVIEVTWDYRIIDMFEWSRIKENYI